MFEVETDLSPYEICDAINVITENITTQAEENNKFAAAMLELDLDEAERVLTDNQRKIDAANTLLQLSLDILPDEENLF